MSCEISSGRSTSCKDATGGIKGIYIHNYDEWYFNTNTTINGDNEVTAISGYGDGTTQSTFDVYYHQLRREMASLDINVTSDPTTGTTFFEQVLTVDFIKLTNTDANVLRLLAYGRPQIVVEDNQGNLLLLGGKNGMDVTSGTISTGQAMGDKNGMQIVFTGRESVAFYDMVGSGTAPTTPAEAPFTMFENTEIAIDPAP